MKANIGGIDMHYEVSGSGPWITLSHSLAANLGMWDAQLDVLKDAAHLASVEQAAAFNNAVLKFITH